MQGEQFFMIKMLRLTISKSIAGKLVVKDSLYDVGRVVLVEREQAV